MYTDEEYIRAKKLVLEWESQYARPVEIVQWEPIKDETLIRFKESVGQAEETLKQCKKRIDW